MLTNEQMDAILPFLDHFTVEGFTVGTWHSPPGQFPWFEFSESVSQFQKALYDNGWITPFDWGAWQEMAREYVEDPAKVESADAETVQKLHSPLPGQKGTIFGCKLVSAFMKYGRHLPFPEPLPDGATEVGDKRRREDLVQFAEKGQSKIPITSAACLKDLAQFFQGCRFHWL